MADLLTLCAELATQSDNVKPENPVLSDCLRGLQSHRVLKNANDESLKSIVKLMNQLLNEPRTRAKGLMLFDSFLGQVDSSRFVAIQESFVSALQLLSKCLDLDLSHRVIEHLLPLCNKVPEFSQAAVASIVPKLLARFGDASREKTAEEIQSVIVCLEKYRGPSGSYRTQLEKVIRPYIDSSRQDQILSVSRIFPLLSGVGGGGAKGERYSLDWQQSVNNLLRNMYDTLTVLYGDACTYMDTDNPYSKSEDNGQTFDLPNIRHADVLLRISATSRRLCNLAHVVRSYLVEPFPAPKPVPVRGILNIISNMMIVNPLSLLKNPEVSTPKEIVYLAGLIPSIFRVALQLLGSLIRCCGSQIFPEVAGIELQIIEQLKWVSEKPGSFEDLKVDIYETLLSLLTTTHGCVTSNKAATAFLQQIFQDVKIDTQRVALAKGGRGKKARANQAVSTIQSASGPEVVEKNELVCSSALKTLQLLIPSLDHICTRNTYILLVSTVWDFVKSGEVPSPYRQAESRSSAFNCIAQLVLTPNPKSPVSVGLITGLLEVGSKDPDHSVASTCDQLLSSIERVINPTGPTLKFPSINIHQSSSSVDHSAGALTNGDVHENGIDSDSEDFLDAIPSRLFSKDSFCQTEDDSEHEGDLSTSILDVSIIKATVAEAFRENLEELSSIISLGKGRKEIPTFSSREVTYDDTVVSDAEDSHDALNETEDEPLSKRSRTSLPLSADQSHMALVEDVHKDLGLEPVTATTSSLQNGYSTSRDVEDDLNVRVEEMLLTFDDELM